MEDALDSRKINKSDFIEESVLFYLDALEDVEVSEQVKTITNNKEIYRNVKRDKYLLNKVNEAIQTDLKKKTFLRYMDRKLADIYLANKEYKMTENKIETLLKSHLKFYRDRVTHNGLEGHYEERLKDPIKYAKNRIELDKNIYQKYSGRVNNGN